MAISLEPKSCIACAKAKRKCDKQQPACRRCRVRGADCAYPPMRPGSFAVIQEDTTHRRPQQQQRSPPLSNPSFGVDTPASEYTASLPNSADPWTTYVPPSPPSGPTSSVSGPVSTETRRCLSWFLGAETWAVDRRSDSLSTSLCSTFLKTFVSRIQVWLDRWAKTGECPFIHSHLYAARFPDDLQVAFTTLSAYLNRTRTNTDIVLRVVEDQASKLVGGSIVSEDTPDPLPTLSLLDQVARLHALIIYQTIGLFDGDIRTRHLAEKRVPLLSRWAGQLLDSARQKFSPSEFSSTPASMTIDTVNIDPWYMWILTENVRRTWLIANGLEVIYFMLQRGWHSCPGGVMFTTRQGLWDAKTELAWERLCAIGDVRLVQRFSLDELLANSGPDDIDEFTECIMEITFGIDRMAKWKDEAQGASGGCKRSL